MSVCMFAGFGNFLMQETFNVMVFFMFVFQPDAPKAMTASCIEGHKDSDSCVKSCDLQLKGLGGEKFLPTFTFFFRCGDYFFGVAHYNTDSCLQLEPKHVTILPTFFSNVSILDSQKMHHPTSDLLLLPHQPL